MELFSRTLDHSDHPGITPRPLLQNQTAQTQVESRRDGARVQRRHSECGKVVTLPLVMKPGPFCWGHRITRAPKMIKLKF